MPEPANPIVLDMAFERLQFETGFDVRAVIAERDTLTTERNRLRRALEAVEAARGNRVNPFAVMEAQALAQEALRSA